MHLRKELENLKKRVLSLGAQVEENFILAIKSLQTRDAQLADTVRALDLKVDQEEVDLEEECLKILALHQPVAIDLRFLIAVLKMNNDLERIGDLSVNIAIRAEYLAHKEHTQIPAEIYELAEKNQVYVE